MFYQSFHRSCNSILFGSKMIHQMSFGDHSCHFSPSSSPLSSSSHFPFLLFVYSIQCHSSWSLNDKMEEEVIWHPRWYPLHVSIIDWHKVVWNDGEEMVWMGCSHGRCKESWGMVWRKGKQVLCLVHNQSMTRLSWSAWWWMISVMNASLSDISDILA